MKGSASIFADGEGFARSAPDEGQSGRSLGEILGDALRSNVPDQPVPFDAVSLVCGHMAARARPIEKDPLVVAADAQLASARTLSRELAGRTEMAADDILAELFSVPDNLLPLLNMPEGWSLLAQFAAVNLRHAAPNYRPTSH